MTIVGIEANVIDKLLRVVALQTYAGTDEKGNPVTPLLYAMPDIQFDPSTHPRYIAVSVALNNHAFQSFNDAVERMGLLQMTVVFPKDGGIVAPAVVASAIVAAWKGVTLFGTGVKIRMDPMPYVGSPSSDATRTLLPVNIPWKAYVN